jgi:hypothetical protein
MGQKGLIVITILLLIFLFQFVSAGISNSGVEYDSELASQFFFHKWVHVTVDINDTSNIIIPDRNSPNFESKIKQKTETLMSISDSVLLTLSKEEFQFEEKLISGRGFSGNITKEGFNKLLNDERVRKIYAKKYFISHSSSFSENTFWYVLSVLLLIIFVVVIIKLKKRKWKRKK